MKTIIRAGPSPPHPPTPTLMKSLGNKSMIGPKNAKHTSALVIKKSALPASTPIKQQPKKSMRKKDTFSTLAPKRAIE